MSCAVGSWKPICAKCQAMSDFWMMQMLIKSLALLAAKNKKSEPYPAIGLTMSVATDTFHTPIWVQWVIMESHQCQEIFGWCSLAKSEPCHCHHVCYCWHLSCLFIGSLEIHLCLAILDFWLIQLFRLFVNCILNLWRLMLIVMCSLELEWHLMVASRQ